MKGNLPDFVGPHEGKELELMKVRLKPLSMFTEELDSEYEMFPEQEFDENVATEGWVKRENVEEHQQGKLRRVFYALPEQAWRIDAMLAVNDLYEDFLPGRRPDFERMIGYLLGYDRVDVERYISWVETR
ncbi:MAG: hypothetical protein K0M60_22105 [Hydrogenophaga sp.]|nr:hypothetical protein [Hydrogenophaga sp.]